MPVRENPPPEHSFRELRTFPESQFVKTCPLRQPSVLANVTHGTRAVVPCWEKRWLPSANGQFVETAVCGPVPLFFTNSVHGRGTFLANPGPGADRFLADPMRGRGASSRTPEARDAGRLAGAALDVFEQEPDPDPDLVTRHNVVCTPHIGAESEEAQVGNSTIVAEKLIKFFK